MTKGLFQLMWLICASKAIMAQVGIGTTTPSAILDIQSKDSGVLLPRMTEAEKNAISPTSEGMIVYQTDGDVGYYFHTGSSWVQFLNNGNNSFRTGELVSCTENSITGYRIKDRDSTKYAYIGYEAVDLSYSTTTNNGANGAYSFAVGLNNRASANQSFTAGRNNKALGNNSTTFGKYITTYANSEFGIGAYNTELVPFSGNRELNRVFSIGIGDSETNRKDALEVFNNGKIYADELDLSEITDNKQIVTKEYVDNNSGSKTNHNIGDLYMGGIVFYVEPDNEHGLIVCLNEATSKPWGSRGNHRKLNASGLYSGQANSTSMLRFSQIAKEVNNTESMGYGGWYLPSVEEMRALINVLPTINPIILNNGGTAILSTNYWTSTEVSGNNALIFETFNNRTSTVDKNSSNYGRGVKRF